jgi:hypothetical protein
MSEVFHLLFARYPQRSKGANQLEQDKGHIAGPPQGERDSVELDQQLLRIAVKQARGSAAGVANRIVASLSRAADSAARERPMVFPSLF